MTTIMTSRKSSVKIKICGLKDELSLKAALDGGVDYVGFVFFPPSPRHIDWQMAQNLSHLSEGRAKRTGLFVNPDDAYLQKILSQVSLDYIQLHGQESPKRLDEIRELTGKKIIKAIGIETADDIAKAKIYQNHCDHIMFDAKPPKNATRPGGLGFGFDWSLLSHEQSGWWQSQDWFLAGGLNKDNVKQAIVITHAPIIDLSSSLESIKGQKSPQLIRDFLNQFA